MSENHEPMLPDPEATMEIDPAQVASWVKRDPEDRPLLIDCREEDELRIGSIHGHTWIPLREIPGRLDAIRARSERGVVVYCHHGVRSLRATDFLRGHGIDRSFSMVGGIDRWSLSVDPAVARY